MLALLLASSFLLPPAPATPATSAQLVEKLRESGDSCDLDNPSETTCWIGGTRRVCVSREVWPSDGVGPPSCERTCFVFLSESCAD